MTTAQPKRVNSRRTARKHRSAGVGGGGRAPSAAEQAIFAATERLLRQTTLHRLTVAEILAEASVTRTTFYTHFDSKYAVVTALLERLADQVMRAGQPILNRDPSEPPEQALWRSIVRIARLWRKHRAVLGATEEYGSGAPELHSAWITIGHRFIAALAAHIDRERAGGVAPPGIESRQLGAIIFWSAQRCFYVAGLAEQDELTGEMEVARGLFGLIFAGIYGRPPSTEEAPEGVQPPRDAPG